MVQPVMVMVTGRMLEAGIFIQDSKPSKDHGYWKKQAWAKALRGSSPRQWLLQAAILDQGNCIRE